MVSIGEFASAAVAALLLAAAAPSAAVTATIPRQPAIPAGVSGSGNGSSPLGSGLGGFIGTGSVLLNLIGSPLPASTGHAQRNLAPRFSGDVRLDEGYLPTAAIPGPQTRALRIAGFGLVGAGLRRRPVRTA